MSLINDKLKKITLKEVLSLIIVLFIIQYLFNSLNTVHIDTVWIYILIILYFIFKLRDGISDIGKDFSRLFSPDFFKNILLVVILNIFFSYGMLYLTDAVLNSSPVSNLFNSVLATSVIASVFISPISEELIFRGVFLNKLKLIVPTVFAVAISSLIFAALHPVGSIFSAFIFGICAAILYLKSENILAPIAFHFFNNLFAEIIRVCDSNNILFTNNLAIGIMSLLAILSFAVLAVSIIRELKILNNNEL